MSGCPTANRSTLTTSFIGWSSNEYSDSHHWVHWFPNDLKTDVTLTVVLFHLLNIEGDPEPAVVQARSSVVITRLCLACLGQPAAAFAPWPSPSLLALISALSPMALTGARKLKWSCAYDYHLLNFLMLSSYHWQTSARCFSR